VTVATKYDESRINVSLWGVGSKGERMEKSRKLLKNYYFVGGLESSLWKQGIG
jgi:hypothetical protein